MMVGRSHDDLSAGSGVCSGTGEKNSPSLAADQGLLPRRWNLRQNQREMVWPLPRGEFHGPLANRLDYPSWLAI